MGNMNEIYYKLNLPSLFRARWVRFNGVLVRTVMEGGNFLAIRGG